MSMTKREKVLIFLVLILAVVCVYYIYFLQPCLKEIDDLSSKKTSDEISINTNQQIGLRLEQITQQINADQAEIDQFGPNVLSAFDQPDVLVYLYKTANKYGEKIMINFNESGEMGQLKYCNITLTVNGSYETIKSILREFSTGDYLVKVTGLSVTHEILTVEETDSKEEKPSDIEKDKEEEKETQTIDTGRLNIGFTLEFYYIGDDIPADKTYTFTEGAIQYGGDIFH